MSDNLQITEPIAEAIGCLNRAEMLLTRNDAFDKLEQLVGWSPSHYAKHWRERAEKAEAEVERLKEQLKRAIEIAELPYCRYLHDAATYHELTKLKATLNPTNK